MANQNVIISFYKNHKIISTLIIIMMVDVILLIISYFLLGVFTNHDSQITVPDLKGQSVEDAQQKLEELGLQLIVNDSTYVEKAAPGSILELNPQAGSKVKEGRAIYATIRTFATKTITIPALTSGMSARQGEALLRGVGISTINTETIPSEFADMIYEVKWNGKSLHAGDHIPVNASVTLVVGDGSLASIEEEDLSGNSDYDIPVNDELESME